MKYAKGEPIGCPKCGYPMKETKELSMSSELKNMKAVMQIHSPPSLSLSLSPPPPLYHFHVFPPNHPLNFSLPVCLSPYFLSLFFPTTAKSLAYGKQGMSYGNDYDDDYSSGATGWSGYAGGTTGWSGYAYGASGYSNYGDDAEEDENEGDDPDISDSNEEEDDDDGEEERSDLEAAADNSGSERELTNQLEKTKLTSSNCT